MKKENFLKSSLISLAMLSLLLMGCTNTPASIPIQNVSTGIVEVQNASPTETATNVTSITNLLKTGYYGEILAGNKSPYIEFNIKDYNKATADGKVILLYFYSDDNSISKAEEPIVFSAFNKMNSESLIGFKIHYDDASTTDIEKQLATSFGVKEAHTKVVLKNGTVMWQYSSSLNADTYITQMSRFLT